jgi:hypothetical protein
MLGRVDDILTVTTVVYERFNETVPATLSILKLLNISIYDHFTKH